MLNLYQSNTLEALARLWLAVRTRPQDPLVPETLLVPSKGMQRWLALWLARESGIAANLNFQLPAAFVWRQIQNAVPGVPARSDFDREVLVWRVLEHLGSVMAEQAQASIAGSWRAADSRGRYQLAWRVADVLDQYLIYRPDWIMAWEAGRTLNLGPDEAWQAALWRRLAASGSWHRARLLKALADKLQRGDLKGLPEQVCLFGVSVLPPTYWELMRALGEHIEVNCFLLNPSREYWGQLKRGEEGNHALLAALGQQGRDFINTVAASGVNEPVGSMAFVTPQEDSLLAVLQRDLLDQQVREHTDRMQLSPEDDSVSIQVCHSALREVEVLHDRLVDLFQQEPDLEPDDVLVMVSDIQRYAPLVDAVFGTRHEPTIPYTIADRKLELEVPLLRRFFELLALPGSRFELPRVLALLEEPALCARFGLQAADLPLIQRWCETLNLRWGRDAADRARHDLPTDLPITWRAVLDRLLLGFALPPELADGDSRIAGIAPAGEVGSVSQARVLARFAALVESLMSWEARLQAPRTLADWADTLDALLAAFFTETQDAEHALQHLRDSVAELREQARLANDASRHEFTVMTAWLKRQVQGLESRRGFLHGAVTVCAMVPMRSLPFRFIAVLGLDDGVFPRNQKPWHFDLMDKFARAGDRSRRLDDRYLFLETLMAARERLYLSYIGRSDIDDSLRAPSPVLLELCDQIRDTAFTEDEGDAVQALTVEHALQPFNPRYFSGEPGYRSYVRRFAEASRVVAMGESEAASAAFSAPLPPPEAEWFSLSGQRLERFLQHPVRFLLRERVGLQLENEAEVLASDEPISLESRQRPLRERLLQAQRLDAEQLRAEGLLPAGPWGEHLLRGEVEAVAALHDSLEEALAQQLPPLAARLEIDDFLIDVAFDCVTPDGLLRWSLNDRLYDSDVLGLWVQHLLLCCLRPEGIALQSRLLGLGDDEGVMFASVENPEDHLRDILAAYREGLCLPLPLLRRASPAYIKSDGDLLKAQAAYEGNDFGRGDADDPWVALAWRDADPLDARFEQWAERIYGPIKEHLRKK